MSEWFAVDKDGLAKILDRQGRGRVLAELVSNSWDEEGTTRVDVTIDPVPGRPLAVVVVADDAPNGFADLSHAFTLFAPSAKYDKATQRGRFNLGEKLVLSLCTEATITSTTGGWHFGEDGRESRRQRRDAGSEFRGVMKLTREQIAEVEAVMATLLVPEGITTILNGEKLPSRMPLREVTATLGTESANEDGQVRQHRRQTTVVLHDPLPGETPTVYELGIPVDTHDGQWHLDVQQKIPLSLDRASIPAAWLKNLHAQVLDSAVDLLDTDRASEGWVRDAIPKLKSDDAVRAVFTKQWGEKAVTMSPSDPESVKQALNSGYTVVPGKALSKEAWGRVKDAGAVRPSGQVFPTGVTSHADGKPSIPKDQWTDRQRQLVSYAEKVCAVLLPGKPVEVRLHNLRSEPHAAWWHRGTLSSVLTINLPNVQWQDKAVIDALLIHECAHDEVKEHLVHAFHTECCRLAAKWINSGTTVRWTL